MEKMAIQEIRNEKQENDINDLRPKKSIAVNVTIENKIQEIEHMLETSPTSECLMPQLKLKNTFSLTHHNFTITVPRLCLAYGDVFGFYTINPKNMAGRASTFKALCVNGKNDASKYIISFDENVFIDSFRNFTDFTRSD